MRTKLDEQGDPEIWGWLVTSRNILLQSRSVPHMEDGLRTAIDLVGEVEIEATRNVLRGLLPRALAHVQAGRFTAAGWILNLVHNMPLTSKVRNHWDIDYFLGTEFASFLEHYQDVPDAREVVLRVVSEVGDSHQLRTGKWT